MDDSHGALGGFFVHPELRNMKIGQKIWDARMQFLGQRNILVMALGRRAQKNMKLGFDKTAYKGNLHVGIPDYTALKHMDYILLLKIWSTYKMLI